MFNLVSYNFPRNPVRIELIIVCICPTSPLQAGCDTRSIHKQNKAGLNSIFLLFDWLPNEHCLHQVCWKHGFLLYTLSLSCYSSPSANSLDGIQCLIELMNVSFCWSANSSVSICRSPLKNGEGFIWLSTESDFTWNHFIVRGLHMNQDSCVVECCKWVLLHLFNNAQYVLLGYFVR